MRTIRPRRKIRQGDSRKFVGRARGNLAVSAATPSTCSLSLRSDDGCLWRNLYIKKTKTKQKWWPYARYLQIKTTELAVGI